MKFALRPPMRAIRKFVPKPATMQKLRNPAITKLFANINCREEFRWDKINKKRAPTHAAFSVLKMNERLISLLGFLDSGTNRTNELPIPNPEIIEMSDTVDTTADEIPRESGE